MVIMERFINGPLVFATMGELSAFFGRFLGRPERDRPQYDFAQIKGSCEVAALRKSEAWAHAYISDGTDKGAQALADYYISFHRQLVGKPGMNGLIEPSASDANRLALELARDTTGRNKVLCTNLSHSSIAGALHTLRMEAVTLDAQPSLGYQVDKEELKKVISLEGDNLAAVVSTFGTTQLGHIERLAEFDLVRELRESGAWLHIDAAYGAYPGRLARKIKIPEADSITIDHYKFAGIQGTALLLVDQQRTPHSDISYYKHSPFTTRTSLSAGPLAAWYFTTEALGQEAGLRELALGCRQVTRRVAQLVTNQGLKTILPPELTIVPIALPSKETAQRVQSQLLERGYAVGNVDIQGKDYATYGVRMDITPKVDPERQLWAAFLAVRMIGNYSRLS